MMFNEAKVLKSIWDLSIGDIINIKCERGIYKFQLRDGRYDYWSDNVDNNNREFFTYFEIIYDKPIKDDYSHLIKLLKNL